MKILIIAEKNSVAKKIASALCHNAKTEKGYVEDDNFVITKCVGHLLRLLLPYEIDEKYKKWDLNNLPFEFDTIPLKPSETSVEQLNIVRQCLKRNDICEVVNACDPDREGELIFRNVYYYSNPKCKNITRMWIETVSSDNALKEAFQKRQAGNLFFPLYESALARSYTDYHIGLNSTVAITSKFGNPQNVLSVGRVQTPTLKIIVDLEKTINNFKSVPFYKILAHTKENIDGEYFNSDLQDNRFDSVDDCRKVIDKIGVGPATVREVKMSTRQDEPRKLFNLSDLQVEMNKRFHYSAQSVLDACQNLYEKHGLTTYPRTSENKISPELASKTRMIVEGLPSIFNFQKEIISKNNYKISAKMVAKKDGVGAHEALTPVPEKHIDDSIINSLLKIELNIYIAIVERFLATFFPNAVYQKQEIIFERENEIFKNKIENLIVPGHLSAYTAFKEKEEEKFFSLKENDIVNINELKMLEGKTEPPARLTEGALLKIMINPSKYVFEKEEKKILEDTEGLGTEATRASIIEELKKRGYIEILKEKIFPTKKGIELIEMLPSDKIKSVSLTAQLEKKLSLIAKGTYDKKTFINEIYEIEREFIQDVISVKKETFDSIDNNNLDSSNKKLCVCPNCKNNIIEGKFGFFCTNKNCKTKINYDAAKHFGIKKISATLAKELFNNGKTKDKINLISARTQKPYQAYLTYSFDETKQYPNNIFVEFK